MTDTSSPSLPILIQQLKTVYLTPLLTIHHNTNTSPADGVTLEDLQSSYNAALHHLTHQQQQASSQEDEEAAKKELEALHSSQLMSYEEYFYKHVLSNSLKQFKSQIIQQQLPQGHQQTNEQEFRRYICTRVLHCTGFPEEDSKEQRVNIQGWKIPWKKVDEWIVIPLVDYMRDLAVSLSDDKDQKTKVVVTEETSQSQRLPVQEHEEQQDKITVEEELHENQLPEEEVDRAADAQVTTTQHDEDAEMDTDGIGALEHDDENEDEEEAGEVAEDHEEDGEELEEGEEEEDGEEAEEDDGVEEEEGSAAEDTVASQAQHHSKVTSVGAAQKQQQPISKVKARLLIGSLDSSRRGATASGGTVRTRQRPQQQQQATQQTTQPQPQQGKKRGSTSAIPSNGRKTKQTRLSGGRGGRAGRGGAKRSRK